MPTDTEKLSDAARLRNGRYSDEYVAERIAKYEVEIGASPDGIDAQIRSLAGNAGYIMSPENKPLPDYCFARECLYLAIINLLKAESTARNDTIARVTKVISFVGCDERITVEGLAEAVTKALTPTQPEASEPAATAAFKVRDLVTWDSLICNVTEVLSPDAYVIADGNGTKYSVMGRDLTAYVDGDEYWKPEYRKPKKPAAPPDSPERCGFWYGEGVGHCGRSKESHSFIGHAYQRPTQPPTAPPETREPKESKLRAALARYADDLWRKTSGEVYASAVAKTLDLILADNSPDPEPETGDAARERERDKWCSKKLPSGMYEPLPAFRVLMDSHGFSKRDIEIIWNDIARMAEYLIEARAAAAGGKRNE